MLKASDGIEYASFKYADDVRPPVKVGRISVLGSTASLWEWDTGHGKFIQIDRLIDVATVERGSTIEITGISRSMVAEGRLTGDSAQVTVVAKIKQGCSECR